MSFDPTKKAEIVTPTSKDEVVAVAPVIEKPQVPTLSPAERIAAARARSMQRSKHSRYDRHDAGFYVDQCGAGSSEYEFHHLLWRAEIISKLPRLFADDGWLASAALGYGAYDRKTGEWIRGNTPGCDGPKDAPSRVSINELRDELNKHLQTFGGVSDVLLEEHWTSSHSVEEQRKIGNMTVAERCQYFRES